MYFVSYNWVSIKFHVNRNCPTVGFCVLQAICIEYNYLILYNIFAYYEFSLYYACYNSSEVVKLTSLLIATWQIIIHAVFFALFTLKDSHNLHRHYLTIVTASGIDNGYSSIIFISISERRILHFSSNKFHNWKSDGGNKSRIFLDRAANEIQGTYVPLWNIVQLKMHDSLYYELLFYTRA